MAVTLPRTVSRSSPSWIPICPNMLAKRKQLGRSYSVGDWFHASMTEVQGEHWSHMPVVFVDGVREREKMSGHFR